MDAKVITVDTSGIAAMMAILADHGFIKYEIDDDGNAYFICRDD